MIAISVAHWSDAKEITDCFAAAFERYRSAYTGGAFQDTVPSEQAIRARITDMTVHVARVDSGELVGTIGCSICGKEGHLRGMAVHPSWHGYGIAERLLQAAEDVLLFAGCTRATLDTTAPLKRAIRFYEKHGFAPSGKAVDFFGMALYEYSKDLVARDLRC